MNSLAHFFLGFVVARTVFGIGWEYAYIILVFSIIVDLDHIPYIIRNFRGFKNIFHYLVDISSRTRVQELYGLTALSIISSLGFFFFHHTVIKVILLCIVLHYTLDFLTGHTRPLYPYSKDEVFLSLFRTWRMRFIMEILLTLILGGILWLSLI